MGGAKDTVDLRERLHRLIEESKLLSVDTKELIKDLGNIANGGYQGGGTGNQRQRLEARKLSDEFTKSLQRFQEVVRSTLSKERESIAKVPGFDPQSLRTRTHHTYMHTRALAHFHEASCDFNSGRYSNFQGIRMSNTRKHTNTQTQKCALYAVKFARS